MNRCPHCNEELGPGELPHIRMSDFESALKLSDWIWKRLHSEPEGPLYASVVGLTAALLLKRLAKNLKIPLEAVGGFAMAYLAMAHEMIQQRRDAAREERELN